MAIKREYIYDLFTLMTALLVILIDQLTKAQIVQHLSPANNPANIVPVVGNYLSFYYIHNSGAAFSLFANQAILIVFILLAIGVIAFLYYRMREKRLVVLNITFGLIVGGAVGNLVDRLHNHGEVIDFIFFQIPQLNFRFAIFNIADAAISIGVLLLFFFFLFSGRKQHEEREGD